MDFKVGDKVKFLNEEGGGIVSAIGDDNMVYVTIDDGFDISTPAQQLIKEESGEEESFSGKVDRSEKAEDADVKQRNRKIKEQNARSFQVPWELGAGVYLVFMAEPRKPIMEGNLYIYLMNTTAYHLHYVIYLEEHKKLKPEKDGEIAANYREFLGQISPEQVEEWNSGRIQVLFVGKEAQFPAPVSESFKISAKRFFTEENYKTYPGWTSSAFAVKLTYPVFDSTAQAASAARGLKEAEKKAAEEKIVSRTSIIDKHITGENEATVDLHIEKLTDDHYRMNSMEMLNTQLAYFRRVLESALQNDIKRFIIIHGTGAGILKAEIRRELEEYDFIEVHDAPIAEYGVGASIAQIYKQ